ncbi:FLYWCH-type zinc finger-containing protein 1-like [Bacillus rossius redtenbacheri]|uniref:FLYWCH-type zinc finger-containing protein 1-like n=1 Tax=Bacillus rossius redtenbacheri TaxID=93214 RepID=UPI002FDDED0F
MYYIPSHKGLPLLVYDGFIYCMSHRLGDRRYWKCIEYCTVKCGARAITQDDALMRLNPVGHCHGTHRDEIRRRTSLLGSVSAPWCERWLSGTPLLGQSEPAPGNPGLSKHGDF